MILSPLPEWRFHCALPIYNDAALILETPGDSAVGRVGFMGADDATIAEEADQAALREILRLTRILNTRDPDSEISRLEAGVCGESSSDMQAVLSAYAAWEQRTNGILAVRPPGPAAVRNVDALGKAYIIESAARAARQAGKGVEGVPSISAAILSYPDASAKSASPIPSRHTNKTRTTPRNPHGCRGGLPGGRPYC